ncbi:ABC-three component system middle component 6 [Flavobacterium beibuense]|uniref:ABC-three component system middle component 6 n=1 Tax=Flavobacterium beibuense TaxID=657326 RepID=UPI003A8C98FB
MIVDKNINPERDLYYLGAILIQVLEKENNEVDYIDLYNQFNKKQDITINLYSLTLDWLFIIGLISKAKNGKIKKCF